MKPATRTSAGLLLANLCLCRQPYQLGLADNRVLTAPEASCDPRRRLASLPQMPQPFEFSFVPMAGQWPSRHGFLSP